MTTLNDYLDWGDGVTTQIVTPTTLGYNHPTLMASSGKGDWNSYLTVATGFSCAGVFCVAESNESHSAENQFAKNIVRCKVSAIADTEKDVIKFLFYMFVKQCNRSGKPITNDSVGKIREAVLSLKDNQYIFLRAMTPRERFRLMGVEEKDIDKLLQSDISDKQLYEMAGNSIVVPVIADIFKSLFQLNNKRL